MPMLGVTIAIFQAGQILLTRREDFEVWCLPGGAVDDGESLAQAAMREAREETGLEVELTQLVGIYSRPKWQRSMHLVLFAARPIGGALRPDPHEVIDAGYFALDALPEPLMAGHRQKIADAFSDAHGRAWSHDVIWPFEPGMSRKELYAMRDRSGLSRQQFYTQMLLEVGEGEMTLEVEGH
ncbi:MAG: NUDIX domain-containing protein [Roseiflexaceae bacterium]